MVVCAKLLSPMSSKLLNRSNKKLITSSSTGVRSADTIDLQPKTQPVLLLNNSDNASLIFLWLTPCRDLVELLLQTISVHFHSTQNVWWQLMQISQ